MERWGLGVDMREGKNGVLGRVKRFFYTIRCIYLVRGTGVGEGVDGMGDRVSQGIHFLSKI